MLKTIILSLFLTFGGVFMIITGIHGQREWRRREERENARASAGIVSVREVRRSSRYGYSTVRYPTVRFTAGGQAVEAEGPGMQHIAFEPGRKIDLKYEPENPAHFHLADDEMDDRLGRKLVRIGAAVIVCAAAWAVLCWLCPAMRL